jgi:cytochrome c-type biogenesis protein CcmE
MSLATPTRRRKRQRLYIVLGGLVMLGLAAALVLTALEDSVVFFYTPTKVKAESLPADQRFRLGGLVAEGSVKKADGGVTTRFAVTDLSETVQVSYTGVLPDLFREGQGVVTEGKLDGNGMFIATEVLAKHDEQYMPPEVADALKESGQWKPAEKPKP